MNGASCTSGTNIFSCSCVPGYSGTLCQTLINTCVSNPCLNGGVCVDEVNMFVCNCVNGFTGTVCDKTQSSIFGIGAVAGGVAAAVAFLIISLVCYFQCCKKEENKQASSATPKNAETPANTGVI